MLILIVILWMAVQMQAPLWVYIAIIFSMLLKILNVVLECIAKRLEKKQKEERRKRRIQAIANGDFEELLKTMGEQDGK